MALILRNGGSQSPDRWLKEPRNNQFIETVSGKGSFVASPNKEFIQEEQLRIAEELLEKVAIIGRTHGISYEQMANILKLFFEE